MNRPIEAKELLSISLDNHWWCSYQRKSAIQENPIENTQASYKNISIPSSISTENSISGSGFYGMVVLNKLGGIKRDTFEQVLNSFPLKIRANLFTWLMMPSNQQGTNMENTSQPINSLSINSINIWKLSLGSKDFMILFWQKWNRWPSKYSGWAIYCLILCRRNILFSCSDSTILSTVSLNLGSFSAILIHVSK